MKRVQLLSILYFFAVIFFSCKKEAPDGNPFAETNLQPKETVDSAKLFLNNLTSDPTAEYYISGEFDGQKINCTYTHGNIYPYQDTGFNAIYLNKSMGLDNIHLVRENSDLSIMIAIYFDKARIYERQFPYNIPRPDLDLCENVEIELINMKRLGTAGQHSPNDNFSFWSNTNRTVKVTVISFMNDIIEGSFEGTLKTETGSVLTVKNGKFRIKTILIKTGN